MRRVLKFLEAAILASNAFAQDSAPKTEESPYNQLQLLARTMQLIRQDYVDESKTGFSELAHNALRGMLDQLDPHSQFMDAKNFKNMQEDTRSEFGGLGVVVTERSGVLTVINPMEDTPGFKAGLLPGDQILKINGESTDKLDVNTAVDKLRGQPGDSVSLTVRRPSTGEIKDYELVREIIKVPSVKDARILPPRGAGAARRQRGAAPPGP